MKRGINEKFRIEIGREKKKTWENIEATVLRCDVLMNFSYTFQNDRFSIFGSQELVNDYLLDASYCFKQ